MIDSFEGEYRWLSNFWVAPVTFAMAQFSSSEHAFQACKMTNAEDFMKVMRAPTPGAAKKLARSLPCKDDWEDIKVKIMSGVVNAKFEQNDELREKLLATGNRFIVEGNTWGDTFWGVCDGEGRNMLGHILMTTRDEMR